VRGGKVEARTDTGAMLVDKANLDSPEIKELIQPDLAKWLGN
jgi:ribose transport system substrate-binding protein